MSVGSWQTLSIFTAMEDHGIREETWHTHSVGLGKLCLKLPVLCYASNSWKCNYYASRGSPIMLTLCNGILPLTQGLGQATCCKLADYGCKSTNCLCVSCSFWTTIDIWKVPMKWIEYFQQAVLLCLLRALYYAGICSYAACIILCQKLCYTCPLANCWNIFGVKMKHNWSEQQHDYHNVWA